MYLDIDDGHINNGEPAESDACPIALALWDAFEGSVTNVSVTQDVIEFRLWDDIDQYNIIDVQVPTPAPMREFITLFDGGLPVQPRRFQIRGL